MVASLVPQLVEVLVKDGVGRSEAAGRAILEHFVDEVDQEGIFGLQHLGWSN